MARRLFLGAILLLVAASSALATDPDTLWERGRAALQSRDFEAARDNFFHLTDGYPRSPHAPDALLALARLTEDPDSARVLLERLSRDYPRTPAAGEGLMAIAEADYALQHYDEVLDELRPAGGDRYPPELRRRALLLLADAALRSGRWSRAGEDYRRVRELDPLPLEDERALLGLAAVARSDDDLREESQLLATAAREHPDGDLAPVVLWQWARSLEAQHLEELMREKMEELADRFPATPEGAAARDVLTSESHDTTSPLPPVIAEHGGEQTVWDDAAPDTSDGHAAPSDVADASDGEIGLYRVRAGRFNSWDGADSLRVRLASVLRDSLGVYPAPEGTPPFAVESREFVARAAAEAFAARLESASGFISVVVRLGREGSP